jgi:hypothetical protein
MTGAGDGSYLRVGDRVGVVGETDHPEDPVGEVADFLADGGVLVVFPLAGAEVHAPDGLRKVVS